MKWSVTILNLAAALAWPFLLAGSPTNQVTLANPAGGMVASNAQAREVAARIMNQRAEEMRTRCRNGCRHICGQVQQILPDGLVVDSGYAGLLDPHFKSWCVTGTATVTRDPALVEANSPGAPCVGLVFLTDIPKRPAVKLYDYVTIQAYPAGGHVYSPLPGIQKTIRQFAVRLPTAVSLTLPASPNPVTLPAIKTSGN